MSPTNNPAELDALVKDLAGEHVNWLFLDLNAYFASVEQQEDRKLRGRPLGVVPYLVPNACCIAVSYEAKAHGVKTGMVMEEAKLFCPEMEFVEGRPKLYVKYHEAIKRAVDTCLPVTKVISVDEMACRLMGKREQPVAAACALAMRVKQAIREQVGDTLRCSIGLAPNQLLAKLAGDMQKPDGLIVITEKTLRKQLLRLTPEDIPGIGRRMNDRLQDHGICTMEQLLALSQSQMRALWGGVTGERMWLWLRGVDFVTSEHKNKSIGHQHVLPPGLRTPEKARAVGLRMLHRAATSMREKNLWARGLGVTVDLMRNKYPTQRHGAWDVMKHASAAEPVEMPLRSGPGRTYAHAGFNGRRDPKHIYGINGAQTGMEELPVWQAHTRMPETKDMPALTHYFNDLWHGYMCLCAMDEGARRPLLVSIHLFDLVPVEGHTPSLFDPNTERRERAADVMDMINRRYGKDTIYPGVVHEVRDAAPTRIPFASVPKLEEF